MVRQRRPGDVEGPSEEWRGLDTLLLRLLLECAPPELVLKFVSLPNNCLLVSFVALFVQGGSLNHLGLKRV